LDSARGGASPNQGHRPEPTELKLLIQPDDRITPIVSAIKGAKKSVEIVIFRFDRKEIEAALKAAVGRGVFVHALIACANRGGEQNLRQLEMRFLDAGVTVARTSNDLVRYHDKMMIIDRHVLYVLSFNYTALDMEHSRGFGIVTRNHRFVQEAVKLFEADTTRQPYTAGLPTFIVSPANARKELGSFIKKAKKELLIYDPEIADTEMLRVLNERAKAGVDIKIIGRVSQRGKGLASQKLSTMRLHTRTIIRDRHQAFVGSQSLRKLELDSRREVGLIVRDPAVIRRLIATFELDWIPSESSVERVETSPDGNRNMQKAVKLAIKEMPPLATSVKKAVKKAVAAAGQEAFADKRVKQAVKKVVKKAVKEAMKEVVETSPSDDAV
jgi:phosphatidylserine/phosphatidylglycerophosphate/cardiolipin synthase-like enzyme